VGLHRLALIYAQKASGDPKYWNQALHYEANALHSLTDLFAFGHVVTNRDETSHAIIEQSALLASAPYRWMENVLRMGGGKRDANGRVSLGSKLPAIADLPTVRNLNGTLFVIYGDGRLRDLNPDAKAQISGAVQASLQALFDAYVSMTERKVPIEDIGKAGSAYFAALRYVPVYVESDPNTYFTGMWTRYARALKDISGSTQPIEKFEACQIPYLSGADWTWPARRPALCATGPQSGQ